jgi:hypothetical protein
MWPSNRFHLAAFGAGMRGLRQPALWSLEGVLPESAAGEAER